ncbi:MAG: cation diffusion facilitator family transporter [Pseudomonadota bacterium]
MAHAHTHTDKTPDEEKRLAWAFCLIAGFMLIELAVGLYSNALVLLADAGHMFLDATALGLAWWAARVSARDPDQHLSYGYHRFQVLAAFINGLTLALLVIWIAIEAAGRLFEPEPMLPLPTLLVAFVGLLINMVAFRWLHGDHHSANVRSAALHVLGDLLGSAAAIIAALVVWQFGWYFADPFLALMIVLILSRSAYRVIRESAHILLEGVPPGVDLGEIKATLCRIPAVQEIHHVHAWALTAEKPLLTLHAQVTETSQVEEAVSDIKRVLNDHFGIDHSTIQVEFGACPDHDDTGHA